jgi:catechol 2,3-dioxygenase-like lactoylglutathione lyase family enzyme
MEPRLSVITLGVRDLARSRKFYGEGLGFPISSASNEHVVFMRAGGVVLALYGREALAEDAHVADADQERAAAFSGVTLAHNARSKAEVDSALATAMRAGATLCKPAQEVFWGGYSGYFADPDGHLWEVAYNPHWPFAPDGSVALPA